MRVIFGERDTYPLLIVGVRVPPTTCTCCLPKKGIYDKKKIKFFSYMMTSYWINDPGGTIKYNGGYKSFIECT